MKVEGQVRQKEALRQDPQFNGQGEQRTFREGYIPATQVTQAYEVRVRLVQVSQLATKSEH